VVMNIVLIGYGRMGKTIERLGLDQGLKIHGAIDMDTSKEERERLLKEGDVAIEFSHPSAAIDNIKEALAHGIAVVSGTTGWLDQKDEVLQLLDQQKGSLLYASNFSIGVNVLFAINKKLGAIMDNYPSYEVKVEEVHHVHKKDAPSGTALTLIDGITSHVSRKDQWSLTEEGPATVKIDAHREGEVFGDHKVTYSSPIDTLELSHSAHTRDGFAQGALLAATWLYNNGNPHKGWKSMSDMMGL